MKVRYAYGRDSMGLPIVTLALTEMGEYGCSVCHDNDAPNKKLGRKIALARATQHVITDVPMKKRTMYFQALAKVTRHSEHFLKVVKGGKDDVEKIAE
jgi:hypothetical protein